MGGLEIKIFKILKKNSVTQKDFVSLFLLCIVKQQKNCSLKNIYRQLAPNAKLYIFDLVGYGQSPLRILKSNVYLIAGWSDKVFDVLTAVDNGESAVDKIMKVEV